MVQSKEIIIRKYKTGDAQKIYTLFAKYTSLSRDAAFWVWINRIMCCDKSIIVVAECEDDIVGHYAIVPLKISYFGESILSGIGIHAFIHHEFSKNVSIFQLTRLAYAEANNFGINFIVGFPNKNFRLISEKIDKWKPIELFNAYEKEIKKINLTTINQINEFKILFENDYESFFLMNELLEKIATNSFILIEKDINYYLNRYLRHPQRLYKIIMLFSGERFVGFVIIKVFNGEIFHAVDFQINHDLINYSDLLYFIENYALNKTNSKKMSLWPSCRLEKEILINNGYDPQGFDTYFGFKVINNNFEVNKISKIADRDNWRLFMGDSDAF